MASNSTTTPTETPLAETKHPTMVTITMRDGSRIEVDLKDMPAQHTAPILDALSKVDSPTNYVVLAKQISDLALNFNSMVSVDLPNGMSYDQAIDNLMKSMKAHNGDVPNDAPNYLKELANSTFGGMIRNNGLYKTAAGTAAAVGAVGSFGRGFVRPATGAWAAGSAVVGSAGDQIQSFKPAMSQEQADAIGAAYAAALYWHQDSPESPTRRREEGPFDKLTATFEYVMQQLWHFLPASGAAKITELKTWFTNGFKITETEKQQIRADAEEFKNKPVPSIDEILRENLIESVDKQNRPRAAQTMRDAGSIAGVSAEPLADAIEKGGIYRQQGADGQWMNLKFDKGLPQSNVLPGPDGKPITLATRTQDRFANAGDELLPKNKAEMLGMAAGTVALGAGGLAVAPYAMGAAAAGARAAGGAARGAAAFTAGAAHGVTSAAAGPVAGATGWNEVRKLDTKVTELQAKEARLAQELQEAKAHAESVKQAKRPGFHPREFWEHARAEQKVHTLENQLKQTKIGLYGSEHVNGKKGWGDKKGALVEQQSAQVKLDRNSAGGFNGARVHTADVIEEVGQKTEGRFGKVFGWALEKVGVHGAEQAAENAPRMLKLGLGAGKIAGRVAPVVAPVVGAGELAYGLAKHDGRSITTGSTTLVTVGGATAIGAGLGMLGGPFALLTVPAGAAIGFTVGNVASFFTSMGAGAIYDGVKRPDPTKVLPPRPAMDPGLQAANLQQHAQTEQAVARAQAAARGIQNSRVAMVAVTDDSIGNLPQSTTPARTTLARI